MIKNIDICVYHKGCSDGLTAAWCVKKFTTNENCKYHGFAPGFKLYGDVLENYKNKTIICVDIMPSANTIVELLKICKNLIILDHHKTNMEIVEKLQINNEKLHINFDMERAGCQLAWDYFNNTTENVKKNDENHTAKNVKDDDTGRLWFIEYVADRDLWKWKLENSKELNIALYDKGYFKSINNIDKLSKLSENDISDMIEYGKQIIKINNIIMEREMRCVKKAKLITPEGDEFIVSLSCINSKYYSEFGNKLLQHNLEQKIKHNDEIIKISVNYKYDLEKREWWISLRTLNEYKDMDVAKIAEHFSGGGHRCAAGFTIYEDAGNSLSTYFKLI